MTNLTYKNGLQPGVVTNLNVAEWKQLTEASDQCGWILNFHRHKNAKNGSVATAYLSKRDARLWEKYDQLVSGRHKGFKDHTIHFNEQPGPSSDIENKDYNRPFFIMSKRIGRNVETNDMYVMSKWLNKALSHKENTPHAIPHLNASLLRKALATAAKDFDGITAADAWQVTELMGHTMRMAVEYYHQNDLLSTETAARAMETIYHRVKESIQFPARAVPGGDDGLEQVAPDSPGRALPEEGDGPEGQPDDQEDQQQQHQQAPTAEEVMEEQEPEPLGPPIPVPSQAEADPTAPSSPPVQMLTKVIKERAVEAILGRAVTTGTKLTVSQVEQSGKVPTGFTAKQIAEAACYMVKQLRIAEITQLFEHHSVAGRDITSLGELQEAFRDLSQHDVFKQCHHTWVLKNRRIQREVLQRLQQQ